jgi:hypothetical protein
MYTLERRCSAMSLQIKYSSEEFVMKKLLICAGLVFVAIVGWRISERLSSDAVGMGIGVLFGVMAGVPAALLVLASDRNRRNQENGTGDEYSSARRGGHQLPAHAAYPHQPPVIVLAGGYGGQPAQMPGQHMPGQMQQPMGYGPYGHPALPGPQEITARQFKVVGEKEEWVDEY